MILTPRDLLEPAARLAEPMLQILQRPGLQVRAPIDQYTMDFEPLPKLKRPMGRRAPKAKSTAAKRTLPKPGKVEQAKA